jgi:hypothetical protein
MAFRSGCLTVFVYGFAKNEAFGLQYALQSSQPLPASHAS